uniref:Movement protein TGB2 n=1 Tax=Grapevine virus T TaxID=2016035 RepID=A0A3G3LQ07_9VIRU|nr:triple gene block 2 protein [Grapevine virus T]QCG75796.1 TGB2 [Grapevine virus T]QCG75801.1 TGB2 [Grapevine virus T]
MSFQQPANWAKSLRPLLIGAGIAIVVHFLRTSNLPHTGDNLHHLPHGGSYQDGTKRIIYCGPKTEYPGTGLLKFGDSQLAIALVLGISLLIYAVERLGIGAPRRCACYPDSCACRR